VQLIQGKTQALAFDDVNAWVERFSGFRRVQLIDLDAAKGTGRNDAIVAGICARLSCRVGGGVRSVEAARAWLAAGAAEVIVGSALFGPAGVNVPFAESLAASCGTDRVIGAIDSAGGRVVIKGWAERTSMTAEDAARQLEPWCGGFLYTHVDTEGMMEGIDMAAVRSVRAATRRRISAAGGITTPEEVAALDAIDVDAVVGMAIYTGRFPLPEAGTRERSGHEASGVVRPG